MAVEGGDETTEHREEGKERGGVSLRKHLAVRKRRKGRGKMREQDRGQGSLLYL